MTKTLNVRLEDVELILYESLDGMGNGSANKLSTKVGIHPDDFEDHALFEHWVDGKCYWWFTESEFKEAIRQLSDTHDLYPLDNDDEMSDND
jgi:hypothetical protein